MPMNENKTNSFLRKITAISEIKIKITKTGCGKIGKIDFINN
tara:strand:+ start:1594 stop:1719 length:126 start_codon:yes stop_codon:yes gene_type:complete